MKELKSKFKTRSDFQSKKDEFVSPSGEGIYNWEYLDKKGETQKEQRNVYEQIQSYADECNISNILQRGLLGNGDDAIYADVSSIPDNPIHFHRYLTDLSQQVEKLKSELKQQHELERHQFDE